jgi:hypothetical protein
MTAIIEEIWKIIHYDLFKEWKAFFLQLSRFLQHFHQFLEYCFPFNVWLQQLACLRASAQAFIFLFYH